MKPASVEEMERKSTNFEPITIESSVAMLRSWVPKGTMESSKASMALRLMGLKQKIQISKKYITVIQKFYHGHKILNTKIKEKE